METTDEHLIYLEDRQRWAEAFAPKRASMMKDMDDAHALALWRSSGPEMKPAIWAVADDELKARIRKLTKENPHGK